LVTRANAELGADKFLLAKFFGDHQNEHRSRRSAPEMKWLAVLLGIVLLGGAGAIAVLHFGTPSAQGAVLPTAGEIPGMVGYQFISREVGWVHLYAGGDVIARTVDGGRSWRRELTAPGLYPNATMQAIDAEHAVLSGSNPHGGVVWETTDGGAQWRSEFVPTDEPQLLTGTATASFLDPRHGWLLLPVNNCGGAMACPLITVIGQLVFETSDGGDHWTEVGRTDLRATSVTGQFVNQETGIAVAGGAVAVTHDGGHTWKSTELAPNLACGVVADCNFAFSLTATMFNDMQGALVARTFDASHGYALVSMAGYATVDGGLTWDYAPMLLHDMEGLVLLLDFDRAIDVTPDSVHLQPGWYLDAADFVDVNHGWVTITSSPRQAALGIGQAEDLFKMLATTDGGVTWRQVALPKVNG